MELLAAFWRTFERTVEFAAGSKKGRIDLLQTARDPHFHIFNVLWRSSAFRESQPAESTPVAQPNPINLSLE
jgi:hypothetical protein